LPRRVQVGQQVAREQAPSFDQPINDHFRLASGSFVARSQQRPQNMFDLLPPSQGAPRSLLVPKWGRRRAIAGGLGDIDLDRQHRVTVA